MKILVIGGDMRVCKAAEKLQKCGVEVATFGLPMRTAASIEDGLRACDAVVLGVPASTDGETLFAPFCTEKITFDTLLCRMEANCAVLGGMLPATWRAAMDSRHIPWTDYLEREEFAIANAIPTAEGAVEIAMRELPITLHGARCLVTGYGRIGKYLSKLLCGLGAKVTVSARRVSDLAWIKALGCTPIQTAHIAAALPAFDLMINTVPDRIFDRASLSQIRSDALLIDLASKPGGVDMEAARALSVRVIWALSLPGRVAPVSAGGAICDTVLNILQERRNS